MIDAYVSPSDARDVGELLRAGKPRDAFSLALLFVWQHPKWPGLGQVHLLASLAARAIAHGSSAALDRTQWLYQAAAHSAAALRGSSDLPRLEQADMNLVHADNLATLGYSRVALELADTALSDARAELAVAPDDRRALAVARRALLLVTCRRPATKEEVAELLDLDLRLVSCEAANVAPDAPERAN